MPDTSTGDPAGPATVRTIEHGEASALPKPEWFWRRWLTYIATIASLIILAMVVDRLTTPLVMAALAQIPGVIAAVRIIGLALIGLIAWNQFIYVAGATGTDCVQMAVALHSTRRETTTTAVAPAPDSGELPSEQRVQP
jgi:hypothetical protein